MWRKLALCPFRRSSIIVYILMKTCDWSDVRGHLRLFMTITACLEVLLTPMTRLFDPWRVRFVAASSHNWIYWVSLFFQGIKRLYPQHFDRRRELRKLNHSLLVNFLDLLDLLVMCPDSPKRAEKVEDLSLLFIHIHHLLNEFRPHQARETLRVMMEMQRRQRIETAVRFQKHLDKVCVNLRLR